MKFNLLLPEENKIITYDNETISRSEILELCSKGKYYDISFNNFLNEHKIEMKIILGNVWPPLNSSLPLFTYDLITAERLKLFLSLFEKMDRMSEKYGDIEDTDEFKFFSIQNDENTIAEIKKFVRRIENSFTTNDTAVLKEIPNPKEFIKVAKKFLEIIADPYFLERRSESIDRWFLMMDRFIKVSFLLAVCSKLAKTYPYIEEIRVEDIAVNYLDYDMYDDDMFDDDIYDEEEENEEKEEELKTYTSNTYSSVKEFKIENKKQAMQVLNMLEEYMINEYDGSDQDELLDI